MRTKRLQTICLIVTILAVLWALPVSAGNRTLRAGVFDVEPLSWMAGAGLLVLSFLLMMEFRRQVRHKTRELSEKNAELEAEIAEKNRAHEERIRSLKQYRDLVESTHAVHWELDVSTMEFTYVGPQAVNLLGYPLSEWKNFDSWAGFLHPDDRDWAVSFCREQLIRGEDHEFMYRMVSAKGMTVWIREVVNLIRDGNGVALRLQGIMFDISQLKTAEEKIIKEKNITELLLSEIHHRVKNNLQIISSMLALQERSSPSPEVSASIRDSRNRIWALALLHEKIYNDGDISNINVADYFTSLMSSILNTYGRKNVRFLSHIQCGRVDINTLIPCGLIINELVTNCLKHAFEPYNGGEISIGLTCGPDNRAVLSVSDNGSGFSEDFDPADTRSMGMLMIHTLVKQIGGSLWFESDGGAKCTVTFDITED